MDTSEIREIITTKRPTLKPNTVKSYCSSLKSIYKAVYPSDSTIDIEKYNDTKKFMEYLIDNFHPPVRKTYLSCLVVLTENEIYREQMMKDVFNFNENQSHDMTEKQQENHLTNTEVNALLKTLKSQVKLIYDSKNYSYDNLIIIQNYILICLFSGKYIPPRRSLDWTAFKIKYISETDNFLDIDEFVFNTYKTSSTYGEQRVAVPTPLLKIIKKYIDVIPEGQHYLFFTVNGLPLSAVTLNQRFNQIFNGNPISVNQFRHLYLSSKYQSHINLEKDLQDMGTSKSQLKTYIQRGDFR